jgi:hypothetical protein
VSINSRQTALWESRTVKSSSIPFLGRHRSLIDGRDTRCRPLWNAGVVSESSLENDGSFLQLR